MIRHESARLLSSFTIFDIVLDRLRLGKMGTSSHFLSAFTIFAQNRLWLGSPRANSDCYPIIKIDQIRPLAGFSGMSALSFVIGDPVATDFFRDVAHEFEARDQGVDVGLGNDEILVVAGLYIGIL